MSKKEIKPEVTIKNTKKRILSAYNDALSLLNAKELDNCSTREGYNRVKKQANICFRQSAEYSQ